MWCLWPKSRCYQCICGKMTLGHKMCKINHFFRIRTQNWIWRPVEPAWCLVDISQNLNILNFAKSQISIFLILLAIANLGKQNFLRHEPSTKNANPWYLGHMSQIGSENRAGVKTRLNFAIFQKWIFFIFSDSWEN